MSWFRAGQPPRHRRRAGVPVRGGVGRPPRPASGRVHGPRVDRRAAGSCCAGRTPRVVVRHAGRAARWPGVRFRPGAAGGVFGVAAGELVDRRVRSPTCSAPHGAPAGRAPGEARTSAARHRRVRGPRAPPAARRSTPIATSRRIVAADPRCSVDALADAPGCRRASCAGASTARSATARRSSPASPGCSASPRRPCGAPSWGSPSWRRAPGTATSRTSGGRRGIAGRTPRELIGDARAQLAPSTLADPYQTRRPGRATMGGMTEIADRYRTLADAFEAKVAAVRPTTGRTRRRATEWTARDLVGHVVDVHGMMLRPLDTDAERAPRVADDPLGAFRAARADLERCSTTRRRADTEYDGSSGARPSRPRSTSSWASTSSCTAGTSPGRPARTRRSTRPRSTGPRLVGAWARRRCARTASPAPRSRCPPSAEQDRMLGLLGREP